MKIYSWNVNGIRSAWNKGFLSWFETENPDIVGLQEMKAQPETIEHLEIPKNYHFYFNPAQKKGYAGVAVFSKIKPQKVLYNIGIKRFDSEGRFLRLDFEDYILISVYMPHGGRAKENLDYKLQVYKKLLILLKTLTSQKVILIGDFNIAHDERDLARPKENKNNIMFLPEEREKIDQLIKMGFIDSFRKFHQNNGHYSWWPYYRQARQRNLGWRLDYIFVSDKLKSKLKNAQIQVRVLGSDHCPVQAELINFAK